MRNVGRAFSLLGIILVFSAALLTLKNLTEQNAAEKASAEVVEKLMAMPEWEADTVMKDEVPAYITERELKPYEADPGMPMPVVTVDGVDYIGRLEIPSLSLTLPVAESWDYDRLKIAPCRYSGSAYTGDLVIAGHNYARHFSGIKRLGAGETVCFTDFGGNRFVYEIIEAEVLEPEEIERMVTGDWDLTLFTCTTGGQTRFAARCIRK